MPKRRAETPAVAMSEMPLTEHLQAADAHAIQRAKRQQELRPAPSTVSPEPFVDPPYNDSVINGSLFGLDPTTPKGRKAIVSTKRAQQNRAAQQAFRQRKDGHIRELEDQVNHLKTFEVAHQRLQSENNMLREYISTLQSSLKEVNLDVPLPPDGLDPTTLKRRVMDGDDQQQNRPQNIAPTVQMVSIFEAPMRSLLEETDEASEEHSPQPESATDAAEAAGMEINGESLEGARIETLESQIEPSLLAQSIPAAPQAV